MTNVLVCIKRVPETSGEILLTDATARAAEMTHDGLERRFVSLKGHPVDALVLRVGQPTEGEPAR